MDAGPYNRRKPKPGKAIPSESIHQGPPIDPPRIHDTCQTDPDLAQIIAAWDRLPEVIREGLLRWGELPEAIRAGIEVMLRTAARG
jgi:hypothetical protein